MPLGPNHTSPPPSSFFCSPPCTHTPVLEPAAPAPHHFLRVGAYLRAGRVTGEGSGGDTVRFVEEGCMVVCEPGGPWASIARADLSSCLGTKSVVDACVAAVGQPQQVCVYWISRSRVQRGTAALSTRECPQVRASLYALSTLCAWAICWCEAYG